MHKAIARFLSALVIATIAACATSTPFGEVASIEAEQKLGEEALPGFLRARGGRYNNARLTRYLNEITNRLLEGVDVPSEYQPLRVQVLDTNEPGAFALPGGAIFLSRGIVALANNEAQIAGVIAHEITHVLQRHSAKRIAESQQTLIQIVREQDQYLRGAPRSRQVAILEREVEARIDEISSFSQEQELEADRLGLQMVVAAGYDPSGYRGLLARMHAYQARLALRTGISREKLEEAGERSGYPKLSERLAALASFPEAEINRTAQDRLMDLIDGMKFDDSYHNGFVQNNVYWSPSMLVSFDIPRDMIPSHGEGFGLLSEHGFIELRILKSRDVTFEALAENLEAEVSDQASIKRDTYGGLPAITERMKFKRLNDEFLAKSVILDLKDRFVFVRLLTTPSEESKVQPSFAALLNSVKGTKYGEAQKRRRYRARRVREDETLSGVLEGATFGDDGESQLQILNGLEAGQLPAAGEWIKFVN